MVLKKKKILSQKKNWNKEAKWVAWLTGDKRWAIKHFAHSAVFSSGVSDAGRRSFVWPSYLDNLSLNANDFRIESSRSDLSCVPEELSFFLLRKTSKTTSLGIMEMLEFWAASTCEELHGSWARGIIFLRLVNCSESGFMSLFPFKTNGSYHFDPQTALRISWWVIKLFYKNAFWTNTESFCK